MPFSVSSSLRIVNPFRNIWICFEIIKRRSIDIYAHDIIKCVLVWSASKGRFSRFIQEKLLSLVAVLGLKVIMISSNLIILLMSSACRRKISVNVSTKGFLRNFEILSLKSCQWFMIINFSCVIIILCKQ